MPSRKPMTATTPMPEAYLGDGVYASFDGYHIWLKTQEGDSIAIEDGVCEMLYRYTRGIDRHFNVCRYAPKQEQSQ